MGKIHCMLFKVQFYGQESAQALHFSFQVYAIQQLFD